VVGAAAILYVDRTPHKLLSTVVNGALPNITFYLIDRLHEDHARQPSSSHGFDNLAAVLLIFVVSWALLAADGSPDKAFAITINPILAASVYQHLSNTHRAEAEMGRKLRVRERLAHGFRLPAYMALTGAFVFTIVFTRLIQDAILVNLDETGPPDAASTHRHVSLAGTIAIGTMFPLLAAFGAWIGSRSTRVTYGSTVLAAILSFGTISALGAVNAATKVGSGAEMVLGDRLRSGAAWLPLHAQYVIATLVAGLIVILVVSLWVWLWARLGRWIFRRRFDIDE
jgi:small-conductance mechanosensitive channel